MFDELGSQDVLEGVIILACIVAGAFFSAAETAITSLGSLKAKHLIDQLPKPQKHLEWWLSHPSEVLTTILVYSTGANVLSSAVAGGFALRHTESGAIGLATAVMTLLLLLFSEVLPKSFAKTHYEVLGPKQLRVVRILFFLGYPLNWAMTACAQWIVKAFRGNRADAPPITEEELEFLVDLGKKAGVIEDVKQSMISAVFDIDETAVREIMTPRTDIHAVSAEATLDDALRVAIETGHSRLPVYERQIDRIVGVLLVKDLLRHSIVGRTVSGGSAAGDRSAPAVVAGSAPVAVRSVMREPLFLPESKLIIECFKDLKRTKNHLAIVIDEYGGTAGLVTLEDILEEIVGDIQDEFDREVAEVIEIGSGVYDVAGSMNVDEFIEYFAMDSESLPAREGFDTVAGWLTHVVGRFPIAGTRTSLGPVEVEVTDVSRHRVHRLRVKRPSMPSESGSEGGLAQANQ